MNQQNQNEEGESPEEAAIGKERFEESKEKASDMSRKEKRKAMKKMKRKQVRKEIASKEREEAEAKLNDPVEQERLKAIEEEEVRIREKEIKEFEESERAWRESMEIKRKKEEEEEEEKRWKDLDELRKLEASENDELGEDEDGEYEYIEEGPPEIIFQGNEIILRKNKVRVPKKSVAQLDGNEIADRPTSNPLPPENKAFPNYQNVSSAQQVLDHFAQEVPNFGTEQDKSHCPFHLKTGACRFGQRCSRVHFYPDKSCTILMKNMYNGPGIAWEQDEGLEVCKRCHLMMLYTDEEAERCYEEFYEDVHTEFLKYGELINFKVCRNGSFHLKGNVYVQYRSLESAILAYQSINGRYFAGKQVKCEFVNISRWKVAICGEYMKSRLKTCSRGSSCNFIHCFRNPGGDYEWADHDKPPPRFWIHKMISLFGYSDEYLKHMEREYSGSLNDLRSELPTDSHRQPSRRSKSRDYDHTDVGSKPSYWSRKNYGDTRDSTSRHKLSRHDENHHDGDGSPSSTRDGSVEREVYKRRRYNKDKSDHKSKWSENSPGHRVTRKRIHGTDDDSPNGDDYGRRETRKKREARRSTESEVQEEMNIVKDVRIHRSSRKYNREGSSTDQEESHGHDRVHTVRERSSSRYSHDERDSTEGRHHPHKESDHGDDGRNKRKRSVETSPIYYHSDKDRDKSKRRHGHKMSDRSRKGKRHQRSSANSESIRESLVLNGNGKRESVSGSSSEESSDREINRERRRRRRSQHSHDQVLKLSEESDEFEGEMGRWRPT